MPDRQAGSDKSIIVDRGGFRCRLEGSIGTATRGLGTAFAGSASLIVPQAGPPTEGGCLRWTDHQESATVTQFSIFNFYFDQPHALAGF